MKVDVINLSGKAVKSIDIEDSVFNIEPNLDCISEVIRWQLAKARSGCHSVKGRSDVRGTTKKASQQKGLGRARRGSLRAAQFRKGGIIFGPTFRSHEFKLNKKFRRLGAKSILSSKLKDNKLLIMEGLDLEQISTKNAIDVFKNLSISSALMVGNVGENLSKSVANLEKIDTLKSEGFNVYSCCKREHLILSVEAVEYLTNRLCSRS